MMMALFTVCPICHVSTAQGARDNDVVYGIVIGIRNDSYDSMTRDGTCKRIDHTSHPSEIFLLTPEYLRNIG